MEWSDPYESEADNTDNILFNRWRLITIHQESLPVRGFIWINVPAFMCSNLILESVAIVSDEFYTPRPYGITYITYSLFMGLGFSFIQWYFLGVLIEAIKRKYWKRLGRSKSTSMTSCICL